MLYLSPLQLPIRYQPSSIVLDLHAKSGQLLQKFQLANQQLLAVDYVNLLNPALPCKPQFQAYDLSQLPIPFAQHNLEITHIFAFNLLERLLESLLHRLPHNQSPITSIQNWFETLLSTYPKASLYVNLPKFTEIQTHASNHLNNTYPHYTLSWAHILLPYADDQAVCQALSPKLSWETLPTTNPAQKTYMRIFS